MWGEKWTAYTVKPLSESKQTVSGLFKLSEKKSQKYLQCNINMYWNKVFSSYG